jgi:hypothetical protein
LTFPRLVWLLATLPALDLPDAELRPLLATFALALLPPLDAAFAPLFAAGF